MDPRVTELHYILPMANAPSVLEHGILSYERASQLRHNSIALQPVQERRDRKHVPTGLRLHQYANLYFHARNPMMYRRLVEVDRLCVLRITTAVLDLTGAVITDCNAASNYVLFLRPKESHQLPWDDIFATSWRNPDDKIDEWRRKSRRCAEVLIPHRVAPRFLVGAHVVDAAARTRLAESGFDLPIDVSPFLFFR